MSKITITILERSFIHYSSDFCIAFERGFAPMVCHSSCIGIIKLHSTNHWARNLMVSDLCSEIKGSRLESGCYLCAEVNSLQ